MVVQADVEFDFGGAPGLAEHLVAAPRVRLDERVLVVGQQRGFVQQFQRHRRLADVVQQAGKAGAARFVFALAELPRQRHHERAHGDGVHVGVVVVRLEPRQAQDRVLIAPDRFGDVVHERQAILHVERAPHARFAEQRSNRFARLVDQRRGVAQFLRERGPRRRRGGIRCFLRRKVRLGGAGFGCSVGECRVAAWRRLGTALRAIDPAMRDAALAQLGQFRRVQREARFPEWMREPGSAQLVQVHPDPQVPNRDFLEHAVGDDGPPRTAPSVRISAAPARP